MWAAEGGVVRDEFLDEGVAVEKALIGAGLVCIELRVVEETLEVAGTQNHIVNTVESFHCTGSRKEVVPEVGHLETLPAAMVFDRGGVMLTGQVGAVRDVVDNPPQTDPSGVGQVQLAGFFASQGGRADERGDEKPDRQNCDDPIPRAGLDGRPSRQRRISELCQGLEAGCAEYRQDREAGEEVSRKERLVLADKEKQQQRKSSQDCRRPGVASEQPTQTEQRQNHGRQPVAPPEQDLGIEPEAGRSRGLVPGVAVPIVLALVLDRLQERGVVENGIRSSGEKRDGDQNEGDDEVAGHETASGSAPAKVGEKERYKGEKSGVFAPDRQTGEDPRQDVVPQRTTPGGDDHSHQHGQRRPEGDGCVDSGRERVEHVQRCCADEKGGSQTHCGGHQPPADLECDENRQQRKQHVEQATGDEVVNAPGPVRELSGKRLLGCIDGPE